MTGEEKANIIDRLSNIVDQGGELALEYILELEKENAKLSKMLNIAIMDRCLWTSDGDIQKETTEYRAELERRVVKMLEAEKC